MLASISNAPTNEKPKGREGVHVTAAQGLPQLKTPFCFCFGRERNRDTDFIAEVVDKTRLQKKNHASFVAKISLQFLPSE